MKKFIFNKLNRIYINRENNSLDFYNPTSKSKLEIKEGKESLFYILKFLQFKRTEKEIYAFLKSKKIDIDINLFLKDLFIVEYDKSWEYEYKNLWEKHNWEDFLFFIKDANDLDFVDAQRNKKDSKRIKEIVFEKYLKEKKEIQKNFLLDKINQENKEVILEKDVKIENKKDFFNTLLSRKTIRNFNYEKISQKELSFILENSFLKMKFLKKRAENEILFSLSSYTNTRGLWIDTLILIHNVEKIDEGWYFYDYLKHSLVKIKDGKTYTDIQDIIIGQKFTQGAAFSIFFSVDFKNIFWKYRYSGAYKNVLLNVAELSQRIIISSVSIGLGTFTTPAVKDDKLEEKIGTIPFNNEIIYYTAVGKYNKNNNYNLISEFYDDIEKDRKYTLDNLNYILKKFNVKGKNILEYGVGTGIIAKELSKKYKVHGVDISIKMLDLAIKKYKNNKNLTLEYADMKNYISKKKYYINICIFDTINHLINFEEWKYFFKNSYNNLKKGGYFIFDINTKNKMDIFSNVIKLDNLKIKNKEIDFKVEKIKEGLYNWKFKIKNKNNSVIEEDNVLEATFDTEVIKEELLKLFKKVEIIDFDKKNFRLYFVCKK